MAPKKITAKEIAGDIRNGMDNSGLMEKYGVTENALKNLFRKLVDAGLVDPGEIESRNRDSKCPACGRTVKTGFDECPGCGIIISKYKGKEEKEEKEPEQDIKPASSDIRLCEKCGFKGLFEEGCPKCGFGAPAAENPFTSFDPASIFLRFVISAGFGIFVDILLLYLCARFRVSIPLFIFIAIPILWGVLGVFFYEHATNMFSQSENKPNLVTNPIAIGLVLTIVICGIVIKIQKNAQYDDTMYTSARTGLEQKLEDWKSGGDMLSTFSINKMLAENKKRKAVLLSYDIKSFTGDFDRSIEVGVVRTTVELTFDAGDGETVMEIRYLMMMTDEDKWTVTEHIK